MPIAPRTTGLGRLLLGSVRSDADPGAIATAFDRLGARERAALVGTAARHGVSGYVARALDAAGRAGAPEAEALRSDGAQATVNHMVHRRALARAGAALDTAGVRWMVVKGPVLVARLYEEAALRAYGDLDLVVPARDLGTAMAALEEHGWPVLDRNWALLRRALLSQVHVQLPYQVIGDVHWHLLYTRGLRASFPVPMDALFARATRVRIDGCDAATLDTADTLIHLALHAAVSGGQRLIWLKDLERLLATTPPDWETVAARSRAWGADLVVGLMLDKARRLLGAEVPRATTRQLSSSRAWHQLSRVACRLTPPQRHLGGPSLDRVVTRATRHSLAASTSALAAEATRRARHRGSPSHEPGASLGSASVFHPAGEPADRQAFLDEVARHA